MGGYLIRVATADEYPLAYTFIPQLFEGGQPGSIFFGVSNQNQEIIIVGGLKVISRNRQPTVYLDIATKNYPLEKSLGLLTHLHDRARIHGFKEILHNRTIESENELQLLQAAGYKSFSELFDFQVSSDKFKNELKKLSRYANILPENSPTISIQPLAIADLATIVPLYIKHFNQADTLHHVIVKNKNDYVLRNNDRSLTLKAGGQIVGAVFAYHERTTLYIESIIVDHDNYMIMAYGYSQLIRQLEFFANTDGIKINKIRFFCDSKIKPIVKLAKRTGSDLLRAGHKLHIQLDT